MLYKKQYAFPAFAEAAKMRRFRRKDAIELGGACKLQPLTGGEEAMATATC